MDINQSSSQLVNFLAEGENIALVVASEQLEAWAGVLAWGLSLEQLGKRVVYFARAQMPPELHKKLKGGERFQQAEAQGLVITLDYPLEYIEQVTSNEEGDRLQVRVLTKSNGPVLQPQMVTVHQLSLTPQLGFWFGKEPTAEEKILQQGKWLLVSGQKSNWSGDFVLLPSSSAPFCQIVASWLKESNLPCPSSAAENLFVGLKTGFQQPTPELLEVAAWCLRQLEKHSSQPPAQPSTASYPLPKT